MKLSTATAQRIYIAVVESDPLRFIGFRALLESEPDFDLIAAAPPEIFVPRNLNVGLLGRCPSNTLVSRMAQLKVMRPDPPIIMIGSSTDDEDTISAIASGAKGYVFDGAPPCELPKAIRVVNQVSIWAPGRVLSTFIKRATKLAMPERFEPLTQR